MRLYISSLVVSLLLLLFSHGNKLEVCKAYSCIHLFATVWGGSIRGVQAIIVIIRSFIHYRVYTRFPCCGVRIRITSANIIFGSSASVPQPIAFCFVHTSRSNCTF